MNKNLELYEKHFIQNNREQVHLFQLLRETYSIDSAIYPGSFVHISPAFIYPKTVFIDNDRRVKAFFEDEEVLAMVAKRKTYRTESYVQAFQQNYEKDAPISERGFDLLISQYAGPVSQSCKRYLKIGGILLVNNSHGDAGLAHLDIDYALVGVANHTKDRWRISEKDLGKYFIPKKGTHPSKEDLRSSMKGIGYTKTASNYLFRRRS